VLINWDKIIVFSNQPKGVLFLLYNCCSAHAELNDLNGTYLKKKYKKQTK